MLRRWGVRDVSQIHFWMHPWLDGLERHPIKKKTFLPINLDGLLDIWLLKIWDDDFDLLLDEVKISCNQVSKEEVMEDLKCLVSNCKLQSLTSHVRTRRVPAGVELHVCFFFLGCVIFVRMDFFKVPGFAEVAVRSIYILYIYTVYIYCIYIYRYVCILYTYPSLPKKGTCFFSKKTF